MIMFSSQKALVLSIKKKRHVLIYPAWQQTFWRLLWHLANVIVANLMQQNLTRFKFETLFYIIVVGDSSVTAKQMRKKRGNFASNFIGKCL